MIHTIGARQDRMCVTILFAFAASTNHQTHAAWKAGQTLHVSIDPKLLWLAAQVEEERPENGQILQKALRSVVRFRSPTQAMIHAHFHN